MFSNNICYYTSRNSFKVKIDFDQEYVVVCLSFCFAVACIFQFGGHTWHCCMLLRVRYSGSLLQVLVVRDLTMLAIKCESSSCKALTQPFEHLSHIKATFLTLDMVESWRVNIISSKTLMCQAMVKSWT